ncbi:MAG: hypothetical protein ABIE36_03085 [Candidatus Diapherotrites archaeon]
MKNKKALSAVVTTVILILLVTVATAIVWTFVKKIIEDRTSQTETCFKVESSEKVTLNDYYTCFDSENGEVQFSLSITDIEVQAIVISILAEGNSKSFTLTNDSTVIANLRNYKGSVGESVKLPGKNEGLTYVASGFEGANKIDWIKISPIIDDKQCESTDTISQVEDCTLLVN